MRRLLMLSLLCVSLACVSLAAGGCGGSSTSTSSSTPSNLVINASPARADVDGGNFITIDAYATVTGTALSSALNFTLTGAGDHRRDRAQSFWRLLRHVYGPGVGGGDEHHLAGGNVR